MVPVDSTGLATTGPQSFTPVAAGDYYWLADYSGDANNAPFTAPCPDPLERVVVVPATPAISTQASTDGVPTLGETVQISDTAALTEVIPTQPGDTITFWLVGPVSGAPPECGTVVDPVIGPLAQPLDPATATATTGPQPFTPVAAGDYYWIAQYTGDANNAGAIGVCPDAVELVTVPPATPTLATQASPGTGTLGVSTQDTATVLGGFGPTGTVTFQLFGPADPACVSTPLATFLDVALVDGTATSPAVITEVVGTYRWVARYNGDANNMPVTGSCDDPTEHTTVVAPADPDTGPPDPGPPDTGPPVPGPPVHGSSGTGPSGYGSSGTGSIGWLVASHRVLEHLHDLVRAVRPRPGLDPPRHAPGRRVTVRSPAIPPRRVTAAHRRRA